MSLPSRALRRYRQDREPFAFTSTNNPGQSMSRSVSLGISGKLLSNL